MRWNSKRPKQERGVAMLLALLTLLLVAIIGMGFMFMANTENSANSNYKDAQKAYFASRAGLESVRSMLTPGSAFTIQANALTAPTKLAPTGVIYVENTNGGAPPDPTSVTGNTVTANPSLDDELCQEQFGGLQLANPGQLGIPCGSGAGGNNELMSVNTYFQPLLNPAQIVNAGTASALPFPWVRVTNKYNFMGLLGQSMNNAFGPTAQVCWDGAAETPIPVGQTCAGTASPTTGGQMNPVWMLTSLAVTPGVGNNPGSRRVTQMEVAINPPFYVLPNGTVSAEAPITTRGSLTVNGYDNCNCTATGGNRPGMICNKKPYAIYSGGTITQNGGTSETISSGESQPMLQNVNPWPYNVDDLINAYRNNGTVTPGDISCTGTPNLTATPAVYASCGTTGDNFGTYPPPPGPPTTSAGSIPQTTYIPGSVKLTGNAGAGVLIIDGDLDVHGGLQFYGLILVRGQINFTGGGSQQVNLYGAILAGQDVNAQDQALSDNIGGSFNFTYDSCALKQGGIQKPGPPTLLAEHEVMY